MNQYIDLFQSQRALLDARSLPVFNERRQEAFEAFQRLGFPSRKVERFKYTDVAEAFAPNYGLNLSRLRIPVNPYQAFRCDVPNLSTSLYFVVNDSFYKDALPKVQLPKGVFVGAMQDGTFKNLFGSLADVNSDAITALNTMLAQDALLLYVPARVRIERPIQVVNILRSAVPLMANRRVLIVVEEDAEVRLLFCDHAADDVDFLTTQVTEVFVGKGAQVEIYELEESTHRCHRFANLYADIDEGAHLTHATFTLTGGLTRNQTDVRLSAPGAEVQLYGCVIADEQQHIDNNTLIEHCASGCKSRELYKYVVDGQAEGAFAGRILVHENAQQTDSQETNANLVCTPEARMWTQPMLEIYADDVKCSHGSTVGQLNDDALFYMQQRGISKAEAQLLLKQAFAEEVIHQITLEPLRDRLHHLVDKRFRGELTYCRGCKLCSH